MKPEDPGSRAMGILRRWAWAAALLAIVALALALRMYGLDWDRGMPYTPHPDERAILFAVSDIRPPGAGELGSLLDADESPWNPKWFPYGSFPLYLLVGVDLIAESAGSQINDLRVTARAISGLADVVTVLIIFLLGTRMFGRGVGLAAAGLVAMAVLHIQLSHFFAVDTLQAMLAAGAIFFIYRSARRGKVGDAAMAGLCMGLGMATKFSQIPILAAFGVGQLIYLLGLVDSESETERGLAERLRVVAISTVVGLLVAVGAFFVAQPYAIIDWTRYQADLSEQSQMVRRIVDYPYTRQYADTLAYWYPIQQNIVWGLGLPLGLLAWAGTLFTAVRGLSWRPAVAYLVAGLVLPAAILVWSDSVAALAVATALAILALVLTLPARRKEARIGVLLLAWVVPYLLITGSFDVKFMRYMIPITPFLVLMGASLAQAIWSEGSRWLKETFGGRRLRIGRWTMIAAAAFIAGSTAFYALSYMSVYSGSHPAVRASEWIGQNVRPGTLLLKEHWEEGLPNLHVYRMEELAMYDPDGAPKLETISEALASAETLVFYSNRLYGTLPRLPERYPMSAAYYELLFSGRLGYELAHFEAKYPALLGVSFVHDTFSRPGLPEPGSLAGNRSSPIAIDLGHADESYSVYDHPTVMVFRNVERYDATTISKLIASQTPPRATGGRASGPVFSAEEFEIQRTGGTWTDIFAPDRWTSRVPVLAWLLVVQGIALLALPLTLWLLRPLADRGYLLSKLVGILLVAVIVWLLASLQWVTFSPRSIALAAVLVAAVSLVVLAYRREEILAFVRQRWPVLVIGEVLFLAAFFAFVALRMANPDLWHPFRGGEKPMELAYLSAVTRSTIMPPLDPWFAGGFINYYYFGQFITAVLVKATGIDIRVAFNLAVPLFFALTAGAAFSLVFNLVAAVRGSGDQILPGHESRGPPARRGPAAWKRLAGSMGQLGWGPVWTGLAGVALVAVLGNLDGAIQLGQGVVNAVRGLPVAEFDFWRSSRMMPPDPPGFEITEFPFFTFLFADLHAHLMAIPFTLLVLGLALAVVIRRGGSALSWAGLLALLGLAVGALGVINTWDFPTYLAVSLAAVFAASYFRHGGFGLSMLARPISESALVVVVGQLVFLPFHLRYETYFTALEATTNTTVLWQFLAISGLFLFVLGTFYLREAWAIHRGGLRTLAGRIRGSRTGQAAAALGLAAIGVAIYGLLAGAGSTMPLLVALLATVTVVAISQVTSFAPTSRTDGFVAVAVVIALGLTAVLEFVRVEGDIDRMNTVFKLYLQVWILLAIASAYALWRLFARPAAAGTDRPLPSPQEASDRQGGGRGWGGLRGAGRVSWVLALALLVAASAVYTVGGTQDRLRDRFQTDGQPLTLDGMAYMNGATFSDEKGTVALVHDLEAIEWMQRNLEGTPIIAEAHTIMYRWGGRISIYTGLPSVIGWQWHQEQQRWDYRQDIAQRVYQVNTLYSTTDSVRALDVIDRYGIEYVYVGELEKLYYPEEGIAKFESALAGFLEPVYERGPVTIYRVTRR